MQKARMVKTMHSWKPLSIRLTGRPKIRREDDVRRDTQRRNVPNWIGKDGKKWLRKPKLCAKSCRARIKKKKLLFRWIHFIAFSFITS